MALKQRIQAELSSAIKSRDEIKMSALRMLKAAILKFEVAGERKEATDEDICNIITKEIKQRQDSAEQFKKGNRFDLAEKEEKEIAVLREFMPPQLSEEEILKLAKEAIAETGASKKHDIGKVMGVLMPKVKGKADGAVVNKIVSSLLH